MVTMTKNRHSALFKEAHHKVSMEPSSTLFQTQFCSLILEAIEGPLLLLITNIYSQKPMYAIRILGASICHLPDDNQILVATRDPCPQNSILIQVS